MKRLFFLLILIPLCATASDSDTLGTKSRGLFPHHATMQFAGNMGMFSGGIGYGFREEQYRLSLLYGYVPGSVNHGRIHSITARNLFAISRLALKKQDIVPYAGFGVMTEVGGLSFLRLPEKYPRRYYFPKAVHVTAFAGIRSRQRIGGGSVFRDIELFLETGTIDAYIWYKIYSPENVPLTRIFSASGGVSVLLRD